MIQDPSTLLGGPAPHCQHLFCNNTRLSVLRNTSARAALRPVCFYPQMNTFQLLKEVYFCVIHKRHFPKALSILTIAIKKKNAEILDEIVMKHFLLVL